VESSYKQNLTYSDKLWSDNSLNPLRPAIVSERGIEKHLRVPQLAQLPSLV